MILNGADERVLNKQIGALILIAIMVASYAALFAFQGETPSITPVASQNQNPSGTPQQTTPIHYTSAPFIVTVQSILPSVVFTATTSQANINALDKSVYDLNGVRNVQSFYRQLDPGTLTFVATVQLDPKTDRGAFIQQLVSLPDLSNIQPLGNALVEVPETIELRNEDLNLSQNHTFKNRTFSILVSTQTKPNDVIQAQLALDLAGETVSNVQGIELYNLTTQPAIDLNESVSQ